MTTKLSRSGLLAAIGSTLWILMPGRSLSAQVPTPSPGCRVAEEQPRIPEVPVDVATDVTSDGETKLTFTFRFAPGPGTRRINYISLSLPVPPGRILKTDGWRPTIQKQDKWWYVEWVASKARYKLAPGDEIRFSLVVGEPLSRSWTYGVGFDDRTAVIAGGTIGGIICDQQQFPR